MTKQTLRDKYIEWNQNITKKERRQEEIFKTLQNMNVRYGDGVRYTSIETNAIMIIANDTTYAYRVLNLINEYNEICGMKTALKDLALATNNFEI